MRPAVSISFGRRRKRLRDGVILLIVLMAIVVLTTTLASVARSNTQTQITVLQKQRRLQQRVAMTTTQRAVMSVARIGFGRQSAGAPAARAFGETISIGGVKLNLVIADEDAKVNLNALYDRADRLSCEQAIGDQVPLSAQRAIDLRPRRPSGSSADRAFASWGEIFDYPVLVQSEGDLRVLAEMTRELSLWGTGRLNVWRASEDSIVAVCRDVVQDGLAQRLAERVRTAKIRNIELLLRQIVSNEAHRRELNARLSDSSSTVSLWIEATDSFTRRQQLSVETSDETGLRKTIRFEFP